MLDEEVIVKHSKNGNERLLIVNALLMVFAPMFLFGGDSDIAMGLFVAMGIIAPINLVNYACTWVDANPHTSRNYFFALFPYLLALILTIWGLLNPVLKTSLSGSKEYLLLDSDVSALFVSGSISTIQSLSSDFVTISAVAFALSLFFITDSRYIIRRILFFCVSIVAVWTILGFAYMGLVSVIGFDRMPNFGHASFFNFPDKSQWAAFSLIWLGAGLTNAIYSAQRFRIMPFVYSLRFLSLASCLVLLAGICYCGTPLERSLAYLLCAIAAVILFVDTIPTQKNMRRHWTSKYAQSKKQLSLRYYVPCSVFAICAFAFTVSIVCAVSTSLKNPDEMLLVNSSDKYSISLFEKKALVDDSMEIFAERSNFGWGAASFANVFAFEQGADMGDNVWTDPHSDLLKKLIETGFFGLFLACSMPILMFLRWLFNFDFSASGFMMLATCVALLALSVVSAPFQCIAVYSSFWIMLMAAFRWDSAAVR